MRLVFEYDWGGIACCGTTTIPVEYKSKDDLLLDFQIACEAADKEVAIFRFFDTEFYPSDFYMGDERTYEGPTVYTLDEWFSNSRSAQ